MTAADHWSHDHRQGIILIQWRSSWPHNASVLLKSSMGHIAGSMLLKMITWSHEVVYTAVGNTASYNERSIPLFVKGYLIVMRGEEEAVRASHLDDLMGD